METQLEQIAVKAVNQLPKSVVREIRMPRSVGAGGGRPPPATRWAESNLRPYRELVLLVFGAPCQLRWLAGQEHDGTIPLADIEPPPNDLFLCSYFPPSGSNSKRLAIFSPSESSTLMHEHSENRYYRVLFEELQRLGWVEGQNLTIEGYGREQKDIRPRCSGDGNCSKKPGCHLHGWSGCGQLQIGNIPRAGDCAEFSPPGG